MALVEWFSNPASAAVADVRARKLSHELRHGDAPELGRRRWALGLSMLGSAMGWVVSLYQTGVVRRLPDYPVEPFDATTVNKAPYAYKRLRTPDGSLMAISYAVTGALASAGGENRAKHEPWIPIALGAKAAYDLFLAVKLGREEWRDTGKLCGYCQTATVASLATLLLVLPEVARAAKTVARNR